MSHADALTTDAAGTPEGADDALEAAFELDAFPGVDHGRGDSWGAGTPGSAGTSGRPGRRGRAPKVPVWLVAALVVIAGAAGWTLGAQGPSPQPGIVAPQGPAGASTTTSAGRDATSSTSPPTTPPSTTVVATSVPAGGATSFSDGLYRVGTEIAAGGYRVVAPEGCYWAKLSAPSPSALVDNRYGGGPQSVVVDSAWFETRDCGEWSWAPDVAGEVGGGAAVAPAGPVPGGAG